MGAGGEYAFTDNLSLAVQYLYMNFEEFEDYSVRFHGDDGRGFDVPTGIGDVHQVTARLNWKLPPFP